MHGGQFDKDLVLHGMEGMTQSAGGGRKAHSSSLSSKWPGTKHQLQERERYQENR